MMFYDNLWKVMKEKGISQYALIRDYHISPGQLTRLKRKESVSTHTIEVFCRVLRCFVGKTREYVLEDAEKKHEKIAAAAKLCGGRSWFHFPSRHLLRSRPKCR